jgi:hypothetical protein
MAGSSYRFLLVALSAGLCVGAANVAAVAEPQGAGAADRSSRELLIAHDSMRNEPIDTSGRGQVQLLFGDQATLSIAPGSGIVINEYLYDPQTLTGNLTATVTTGLLRYVGGEISRKQDVLFYTPGAVVSVRGGITLIKTERNAGAGRTEALFLSGDRMCVTANGQSQCTTTFATAITSEGGGPPSAPVPVTTEAIQALFSNLQAAGEGAN